MKKVDQNFLNGQTEVYGMDYTPLLIHLKKLGVMIQRVRSEHTPNQKQQHIPLTHRKNKPAEPRNYQTMEHIQLYTTY